jgi:hypothetical protein
MMTTNRLLLRVGLVLLAAATFVQCGGDGGESDDAPEVAVTTSPTPIGDVTIDTPMHLTPTPTPSDEPFPGTLTVTPTPAFHPATPICTCT